jgi:transcriptional regulator with XRE-family HTH domain
MISASLKFSAGRLGSAAFAWKVSSVIALDKAAQYSVQMQQLFLPPIYPPATMNKGSHLKTLREAAGLSQRELGERIGEIHSNIHFWESSGTLPRSDVLLPMAKALGVTVEELLGEARPRRAITPGGKLGSLVEQISKLPRRQQEKVVENLATYLRGLNSKPV